MTVLHTGSNNKFSANWGSIFGKGKKTEGAAKTAKPAAAEKAAPKAKKKAAAKKPAAKKKGKN
jgi:hypothetical protein